MKRCGAVLWMALVVLLCAGWIGAEGSWRVVGSTSDPRESSGVFLLEDGRVLVAGGHAQTRNNPDGSKWRFIGTSEIYDPKTETWSAAGDLVEKRQGVGELIQLANGKILLAGEHDPRKACELFDPKTGTWSATGELNVGRGNHRATLLLDGRVLVAGGIDYYENSTIFDSAEIYDPATEKWTLTAPMSRKRFKHAQVRLNDGRVMAIGGTDKEPSAGMPHASVEIYDPAAGAWSETGPMTQAREQVQAVVLGDGRVLVAGGAVGDFRKYRSQSHAEIYDPATGKWTATGAMNRDRTQFHLLLLSDGRAMAIGGVKRPPGTPLAYVEIYDPTTGKWTEAPPLALPRWNHRAVLLPNGDVFVVGGYNHSGELKQCEVFAPGGAND